MKMTADQLEIVKETLGADPVPEDNPSMGQLKDVFGDHSFYVSEDGLLVFEPEAGANSGSATARLVMVAAWTDDTKSNLSPVEPKPTGITVDLNASDGQTGDT